MKDYLPISLSKDNPSPLYRQLGDELMRLMKEGIIQPGLRLPPIRQLSEQLHINTGTAVAAYRYLEAKNAVYTKRGSGVFAASRVVAADSLLYDTSILSDSTVPPELFPSDGFSSAIRTLLSEEKGNAFLQPRGDIPTHTRKPSTPTPTAYAVLDKLLIPSHIHIAPKSIIMTSGTEANIKLICRHLLSVGDTVFVPELTSNVIVTAFLGQNMNVHTYSVDSDAADLETLIRQRRPSLFYVPVFCEVYGHIPPQVSILNRLSKAYSFHTVCDISTLPLSYGDTIVEYDVRTIFTMSFGRAVLPSLPVGFVAFPQAFSADADADADVGLGVGVGVDTTSDCSSLCDRFIQKSTGIFLETGFSAHITSLRSRFKDKLRLFCDALPPQIFTPPIGGVSVTLDLGLPSRSVSFCNALLQKKIIVKPLGILLQKQSGLVGISLANANSSDILSIITETKKSLFNT